MEKKSVNVFGMQPLDTREALPVEQTKSQMMARRKALINSNGEELIQKAIRIALDDEHPSQGAMMKQLLDRLLPASEFEKMQGVKTAIQINITGIDSVSVDGEAKEVTNE